jgi:hypothetical protein
VTDPLAIALGVITIVLLPVIGYFLRRQIEKLEQDVNAIGAKVNNFQLEVAREYVSIDRLEKMLSPIMAELEKIDSKLDRKVDR